jgi:branched-chain amino acid transport system substrate-binding protein
MTFDLARICALGSVAGAALALTAGGPALAESGVTKDTIKIGILAPLSGPVAIYGYPITNGAAAVFKRANDEGGIHGRKIEIVYEDDACDAAKARAAAKKLIHSADVFMINGSNCSLSVMAARQEVLDNKVPLMVMASTLDKISDPVTRYIFTTTPTGGQDGTSMVNFVKSMPTVKRVAMVRQTDEWGDAHVATILEGLKGSGIEMVANLELERNVKDATTQVLKIKELNPDAVFVVSYSNETAVVLRDARKYGLQGPFIAASANMDMMAIAERAGGIDHVNNTYVSSYLIGPIGSPEMKDPTEMYQKYFPNDKLQTLSFYGMSGAYAIVEALRRVGPDLTREKFVDALEQMKGAFAGPAFCKMTFSKDNHRGCVDAHMWAIRDGKVIVVGPTWKQF